MRRAFIETLCNIAQAREDVVLLCGDLGYSVLEVFRDRFPNRYLNTGVAEQNMMGMAAGMAAAGKIVVTYSIANFALTRCLEQFRNDACYHNLPVIAVSVGAGVAYGSQGYTHHGIEDIGFTRALPNIVVVSPGDPVETHWALTQLILRRGPASLRLGRGGEPVVHSTALTGDLYRAIELRPIGKDVTILSHGAPLAEAASAAATLNATGVDVGLLSMPCVAPLDITAVHKAAKCSRLLVSVEEHITETGFGGAVAEQVAGMTAPRARLLRAGIAHDGAGDAKGQHDIRRANSFDAAGLVRQIKSALAAEVGG